MELGFKGERRLINLIHNPNFPNGMMILAKDTYEQCMGNLEFDSKCVFFNKNLSLGTAVVSTDIFKKLTKGDQV